MNFYDFLNASPQKICNAYWDQRNGTNSSQWDALLKGAEAAAIIGQAIIAASAAGAGALTGYAGVASAVSTLGLSSVTATAATFLGSSAVGAAATSVVTSAVGGPLAMAAVIVSILASGVFAANYLAWTIATQLGDWALQTCR